MMRYIDSVYTIKSKLGDESRAKIVAEEASTIYVQMHSFRGFDSRKHSLDALQRDSRGVLEIVIKRREWIRMTVVKMGLKYSDGLSRYSSIVEYFGKLRWISMKISFDYLRLSLKLIVELFRKLWKIISYECVWLYIRV